MRSSLPFTVSVALFTVAAACGSSEDTGHDDPLGGFGGGGSGTALGGAGRANDGGGVASGGAASAGTAGRGGGGGLGGSSGASSAGAAGAGGAGTAGAGRGGTGGGGTGGGTSVVFPPNCSCLNQGPPVCTPTGNVTFTLNKSANPTAQEEEAYERITCAMTAATAYYNCNTTITKQLSISYTPSVSTADANFNGSIRFGSDRNYMVCATAMHEVGHAVGIGTAPNWSKVSVGGLFQGETAIAKLREITGNAAEELHSDTQHFWPYGLNYASEAESTSDLVNHCLMVSAMRKDLGL